MSDLVIRPYRPDDIPAVTEIYGHYVRETVITFETSAPDEAEMAGRFAAIAGRGHPLLIGEIYGAMGCRDVTNERAHCVSRGDPHCRFITRWRGDITP